MAVSTAAVDAQNKANFFAAVAAAEGGAHAGDLYVGRRVHLPFAPGAGEDARIHRVVLAPVGAVEVQAAHDTMDLAVVAHAYAGRRWFGTRLEREFRRREAGGR